MTHVTRPPTQSRYGSVRGCRELLGLAKSRHHETDRGIGRRDRPGREGGVDRQAARGLGPDGSSPKSLPPAPSLDPETARANIRRFLEGLLAVGITNANVAEIALPVTDQWRWIQDTYDRWGDQLPRVILQPRLRPAYDRFDDLKTGVATTICELEALPFHTGFGNERLKIGAIKMSVDGAFSGPDAWTLEAYPDQPGYHGSARTPEAALYPVAKRAHELGWQLGFHAIGDAAIQLYVNVLERILTESPRADARPYIHHFTMLPPAETLEKMAELGIIVSSHPNWTYSKMQFISEVLSGEALARAEPQQSVLDHGLRLTFGSDGMPTVRCWRSTVRSRALAATGRRCMAPRNG